MSCKHLGKSTGIVKLPCHNKMKIRTGAAVCLSPVQVRPRCLPKWKPADDRYESFTQHPENQLLAVCARCEHFEAR